MDRLAKRILITGQCTLHWGRMEYGNIGNYYIIEPFFEQLRRVFPYVEFVTTMQFSKKFCDRYGIITLPMECYYDFSVENNLELAQREYKSVVSDGDFESLFVKEVKRASLVIDFSGDIWGDNADFLGKDRFATGCYKDLVAQELTKTVMIAGSPGPFSDKDNLALAKKTYEGFDLVINRESISTKLLSEIGFSMNKTVDYPCPSFLFSGLKVGANNADKTISKKLWDENLLKIGLIVCGWNFKKGPYDRWPREDGEYENWVLLVKSIVRKNENAVFFLMSHSNGFDGKEEKMVLKQGRDYPIVKQLYNILRENGFDKNVVLLDGIYLPNETKGIIGNLDVLISGRMHGAVAGLSQAIPTVIMDYGHAPKAHKLMGFAEMLGIERYLVDPNNTQELIDMTEDCINNRNSIRKELIKKMEIVKKEAITQFDYLERVIKNGH